MYQQPGGYNPSMGLFPQSTFPQGYSNNFSIGNQFQQAQQMPKTEVVRVNGLNGAQAYNMPPNSSILLLDETSPTVYLKTTDGAGYPTITAYSISPIQAESAIPSDEYSDLVNRVNAIEQTVQNLQQLYSGERMIQNGQSNYSGPKRSNRNQQRPNNSSDTAVQ